MTQTRRATRICDLQSLSVRSVLTTYLTPQKKNHLAPHNHVGFRNGDFDSQSPQFLDLADGSISLHDAAMNEQVSPGSTETRLLPPMAWIWTTKFVTWVAMANAVEPRESAT